MRAAPAAVLLAAASLALAGCGETTVSRSFDPSLIRQLGAGSDTLAGVVPTLQSLSKANSLGSYSDPRTSNDWLLLAEGKLQKLGPGDLERVANANRASVARLPGALHKLDALSATVVAATVPAHHELTGDANRFIARWNAVLAATAAQVKDARAVLGSLRPAFNQLNAVIAAAAASAASHSTGNFNHVRLRFVNAVVSINDSLQGKLKADQATLTSANQKLGQLVASSQQAQAIVQTIDQAYPRGDLAQEYRRS